MNEVYIVCDLCYLKFGPKQVAKGLNKLQTFKGYTVDLRLQQFRKIKFGKLPEFIEFASPNGKKLLAQMHERATQ